MASFPQTQTTRYFQLLNSHQITEAHRQLQRIKEQIKKTEWNRGYYRALIGMLLAKKHNGNPYTLLQNLNTHDQTILQKHKQEFLAHIQSRFHDDYDRGYFSAWHDYTRLLIKTLNQTQTQTKTNQQGQTSLAQYAETTTEKPQ